MLKLALTKKDIHALLQRDGIRTIVRNMHSSWLTPRSASETQRTMDRLVEENKSGTDDGATASVLVPVQVST